MARKGKGDNGVYVGTPYNEVANTNPETPDMTGDAIYFGGYPEMLNMHLKEESMESTPNSRSGEDILGTPIAGEPQAMKK